MFQELKNNVKSKHAKKVTSWNRLAANPYTKANENQYYMDRQAFDQVVLDLVRAYKRHKLVMT